MKLTYRPEIDGLRAIAVGAVILYHAQITIFGHQLFKGGFIGVDIFFVISGYLITSIILKELVTNGSFSFKHFYERRIRRILPALLLVMLVSLTFSYFFIFPTQYENIAKSSLASSFFISNYFFYSVGNEYDEIASRYIPLLHTWSLSIEEIFYLFFPLSIFLIFKFNFKYLNSFFIIISLASFFSIFVFHNNSLNFYSIHSRLWELLVGGFIAYNEIIKKKNYSNNFISNISMLIILVSIIFFDLKKYTHPSVLTIFPVLATAGIILFKTKTSLIKKILTSKIFVNVGLLSYSLYLWHYPIFTYERILDFSDGLFYQFFLVVIIFILSYLTFNFVEKPFRRNKKFKLKYIFFIFFISITLCLLIILNKGLPKRFDEFKEININYNIDNIFLGKERDKHLKEIKNVKYHNIFVNSHKKKIIIIGDSHGVDLFNAFYSNKFLFKDYIFYYQNYPEIDFNSEIYKTTKIFILSVRWSRRGINNFDDLITKLIKDNKTIVLTTNSNEYKTYIHNTIIDHLILNKKIDKLNYFNQKHLYFSSRIIDTNSKINLEVVNLAKKYGLKLLNKEDYLCNLKKLECDYLTNDGYKTFTDYGHYTIEGAKFFGRKIYEINWLKID
jgi:peptidoglycan/LPS O-acetylase OafA/YrhL